jgi:hypothetical protein
MLRLLWRANLDERISSRLSRHNCGIGASPLAFHYRISTYVIGQATVMFCHDAVEDFARSITKKNYARASSVARYSRQFRRAAPATNSDNLERLMATSLASLHTGGSILTAPSDFREFGGVTATETLVALSDRDLLETHSILFSGDEKGNAHAPLPPDIRDLLLSTARFTEAILQLDRRVGNRQAEGLCYDALAAVKQGLRLVVWSRALE